MSNHIEDLIFECQYLKKRNKELKELNKYLRSQLVLADKEIQRLSSLERKGQSK